MLISFSGLPGVGKTAIARELARRIGAVYLRIDSIEQAIRNATAPARSLDDAGYRVAYAVAEDNLRIGRIVVADCVNPLPVTRDAWLEIGRRAATYTIEVEIICSDPDEHKSRVQVRVTDIPGLLLPNWEDVISREYHPWNRQRIVIDTAGRSIEDSVESLCKIFLDRDSRR
ncbi:MAG: AAA family ATPase [Candidatus Acidiferrales bacterium]